MSRVLVTGAGGFVGANLVRTLVARGDEVHAFVRSDGDLWRLHDVVQDVNTIPGDIASADEVERAVKTSMPDVVFHLAHYGGNRDQSDPLQIRRVIIDGTANLFAACEHYGGIERIINTGSSSEYGMQQEPMSEHMRPEPNTDYGVAKVWATLFGEHVWRDTQLPVTTLRLFSVYGPYEAAIRFFPATILALMRGESPALSSPATVRDFIHVDDVVAAYLAAIDAPPGVYNVGTGVETTLKSAVQHIQSALGNDQALTWGGETGRGFDTVHWRADTSDAKQYLGWEAKIPIAKGVSKTVEWFQHHKNLYG